MNVENMKSELNNIKYMPVKHITTESELIKIYNLFILDIFDEPTTDMEYLWFANYYLVIDQNKSKMYCKQVMHSGILCANVFIIKLDQIDIDEMIEYYLFLINGGSTFSLRHLGGLYRKLGNMEEAEKYALLAAEKESDPKRAYELLSLIYYLQKNYELSEKYCLLDLTNAHCFRLANIYMRLTRYEDAKKYFLMLLDRLQSDDECLEYLGQTYYGLASIASYEHNLDDMKKYLLLAVEKNHVKSMYYLGILFERNKQINEAKKYYLIATDNNHIDACHRLGSIYYKENEFGLAKETLLKGARQKHINSLILLGQIYEKESNILKAKKIYLLAAKCAIENKCASGDKSYSILYDIAAIYQKLDNLKKAKKYYLLSIKLYKDVRSMYALGIIFRREPNLMIKYLEMASLLNHQASMNELLNYYRHQQNYYLAIDLLARIQPQPKILYVYDIIQNFLSSSPEHIPTHIINFICTFDAPSYIENPAHDMHSFVYHSIRPHKIPASLKIIQSLYKSQIDLIDLHFQYVPTGEGAQEAKRDYESRIGRHANGQTIIIGQKRLREDDDENDNNEEQMERQERKKARIEL